MQITVRQHTLRLAETFTIPRGSSDEETVLEVALEHDGIVGYGEGAPVDFWGETPGTMTAFLQDEAPALLGDDPLAREAIAARDPDAAFAAAMRHIQSALKARTEVEHRQLLDHLEKLSGPAG